MRVFSAKDEIFLGSSEIEIVRDCLFVLQGAETDLISWEKTHFVLKPSVSIAAPARILVSEVLETATDYRQVSHIIMMPKKSLVFQTFRHCV